MTSRWLICFSWIAFPVCAQIISGTVELRDSREPSVRKDRDYSGVVISLRPAEAAPRPPVTGRHAQILQKNKFFKPHLLPIETGTIVDFPNADPIFHNAFSSFSGQIFDIGLYPPGSSRSVRFLRPGVVRVFCNIHPAMSAVIVVLDTPYYARTDMHGAFEITAPPGDYELHVYHERASEEHLRALTRTVHVVDSRTSLPPILVSESGYLPSPHKNKHGMDYTLPDDGSQYPGARR